MLHYLEFGNANQGVLRQVLPHEQVPECIVNTPKVLDHLLFYYDAFWELDSERQIGMGVGPIPWSSIMLYASFCCLDEFQTEQLLYFIRAMDKVYLQYHSDKNKSE
ncbi:MAG: hypothetical protein WAN50_00290 [Minisyncoccia bacterium]